MKILNRMLFAVIILSLCSCSTMFTRQGYKLADIDTQNINNCNVLIKNNYQYNSDSIIILGKIKASDTQFSVNCAEDYVLSVFLAEACALKADMINITTEKYPDFWSTCYRAQAEFIRFKDEKFAQEIESDEKYAPNLVQERSKRTEILTKRAIEAGVAGGISAGMSTPAK